MKTTTAPRCKECNERLCPKCNAHLSPRFLHRTIEGRDATVYTCERKTCGHSFEEPTAA